MTTAEARAWLSKPGNENKSLESTDGKFLEATMNFLACLLCMAALSLALWTLAKCKCQHLEWEQETLPLPLVNPGFQFNPKRLNTKLPLAMQPLTDPGEAIADLGRENDLSD